MLLLIILMPCKPPLLGGLLLGPHFCWSAPFSQSLGQLFQWLVLGTLEIFVYTQGCIGGCFYAMYFLFISISHFYLSAYSATNGQSSASRPTCEFATYRQLQVHGKIMNACYKNRIFPTALYLVPFVQIIAGHGVIQLLKGSIPFEVDTFMLVCMYCDATPFNILITTFTANIVLMSRKWLKLARSRCKTPIGRRILRSMKPVRMEFGNNFVDCLTPLVIQKFCARQTATMLLIKK